MKNATERLAAWRDEIRAELKESRGALTALEAECAAAAARAAEASRAYADLQATLGSLRQLEGPLAARLADARSEKHSASGAAAQARGMLEAVRDRVRVLSAALAQVDFLLAPAEPKSAA